MADQAARVCRKLGARDRGQAANARRSEPFDASTSFTSPVYKEFGGDFPVRNSYTRGMRAGYKITRTFFGLRSTPS